MSLPVPRTPQPGTDLVPDGWWETTVVPWADEQDDELAVAEGYAKVAAVEAAWRTMGLDTLELAKGRRVLEVRWGELLPSEQGKRSDLTGETSNTRVKSSLGPMDESRFRKLAGHKDRVFDLLRGATDPDVVTRASILRAVNGHGAGKAVVQSITNDWWTPAVYIDAARNVLGGIDLDPASCDEANKTVKAKTYYTVEDDGLEKDWRGRVWLNPPYGRTAGRFVARLEEAYDAGDVTAAICLVNAHATDTSWFQSLWDHTLCFTDHRIDFKSPDSKASGSTHGSVFVYFGDDLAVFAEHFAPFGAVVRRYEP